MRLLPACLLLCATLLSGCASGKEHRGQASTPGAVESGGQTSVPAAPSVSARESRAKVGTNIFSERAANAALSNVAANPEAAERTGLTGTHFGLGTGEHGPLFWFYVLLGIAFLSWLALAIRHRVRNRPLNRPAGSP